MRNLRLDVVAVCIATLALVPSAPDEVSVKPGTGYVRTEGSNSKGQKFANFYHFAPAAITSCW